MLKWQYNYYTGAGIRDPEGIRDDIEKGKLLPRIFLLTLSKNPGHLMEILPSVMLGQKIIRDSCPLIIGMAKGKKEAMNLAGDILMEAYRATGSFRLEEYLKNR